MSENPGETRGAVDEAAKWVGILRECTCGPEWKPYHPGNHDPHCTQREGYHAEAADLIARLAAQVAEATSREAELLTDLDAKEAELQNAAAATLRMLARAEQAERERDEWQAKFFAQQNAANAEWRRANDAESKLGATYCYAKIDGREIPVLAEHAGLIEQVVLERDALCKALNWALDYGDFDCAVDNPMHARALDSAQNLASTGTKEGA